MAKRRSQQQLPAARGRQTGELSWSFRARGRGNGSLGTWLVVLALATLVGLVGVGDDTPAPAPGPSGDVVEQGTIQGVDYQIRRASDGYQGWVVLDGQWSQLDPAHGSDLDPVRDEIRRFIEWLNSDAPMQLFDRSNRWPLPESFKGRTTARDPSRVDTIVVHQTGVPGGFGLTAGQIAAAGGDVVQALLSRYEHTPYHAIASPRAGRRLSVFQWPVKAYSYHGHDSNANSIGWAYDGALPGDTLDVVLARDSFAHAVELARKQGAPLRYVEAHRQHSSDRGGDPGEEIWSEVVLPSLAPLGLELSSRTTGDGNSIPSSWS